MTVGWYTKNNMGYITKGRSGFLVDKDVIMIPYMVKYATMVLHNNTTAIHQNDIDLNAYKYVNRAFQRPHHL